MKKFYIRKFYGNYYKDDGFQNKIFLQSLKLRDSITLKIVVFKDN